MTTIAFIGLGNMGLPMATHLINANLRVHGYDLNQDSLKDFDSRGGHPAADLSSLNECDIFITMLQTGEQVKKVCLSEQGLFAIAKPGALFIDSSSIDVSSSREIHERAKEERLLCVDAPVSGGVVGAEKGTLTFMVGGEKNAFDKAKTLLEIMGKKIIHAGPAGTGQAAKICNNMILGISMIGVAEGFTLAQKLGLSPEKFFEISSSASGQCWAMTTNCPVPGILDTAPASHDYKAGFASNMMLKDLLLSQDAASHVDTTTPLGKKVCNLYQQFVEQGQGQLDFSAIITMLAQGTYDDTD